jgi:tRNA nucleotidyltransferase (CCA-adding enzyme)
MNSLAMTVSGEIIDEFGGKSDIENKTLRHTSSQFSEDPLRVLRGFQFVARFDMSVAEETINLAKELKKEFSHLPKERVWGEWEKFILKGEVPSKGLQFLRDSGWVELFPELNNLIGLRQEPSHHPEGDVWNHTLQVSDVAWELSKNLGKEERMIVRLASLLHDLGKIETTEERDGKIISHGHDQTVDSVLSFLKRVGAPKKLHDPVIRLVKEHMFHINFINQPPSEKTVRRLVNRLSNDRVDVNLLGIVVEADHSGRKPLKPGRPEVIDEIIRLSNKIGEKVEPLIMGRHLIELNVKPGPRMGEILKELFEAQLDGEFDNVEDGIEFAKTIIP